VLNKINVKALEEKKGKSAMNPNRFRVDFDPLNRKELEEAKSIYQKANQYGRVIYAPTEQKAGLLKQICSWLHVNNGFIVEAESENNHSFPLRILDETGDRRLVWDCRSNRETNEAAIKFDEYIQKGHKAYAINRNGKKNYRIIGFDPKLEEVIFIDNNREKLTDFCKKVAEVRMVPKTRPG